MTLEERVARLEEALASLRGGPAPNMQTLRIEALITQMRADLGNDLSEIATHIAEIEQQTAGLDRFKADVGKTLEQVLASLAELRERRSRWPWQS